MHRINLYRVLWFDCEKKFSRRTVNCFALSNFDISNSDLSQLSAVDENNLLLKSKHVTV